MAAMIFLPLADRSIDYYAVGILRNLPGFSSKTWYTEAKRMVGFLVAVTIALLRGINVSGQKQIKMTELKSMFERMGFARVQTYIQSGNVLFESEQEAETLRQSIEREIESVFGFQVTVVVRTLDELERIIAKCPFAADALAEGESLYVSLLAETPSQTGVDKLLASNNDVDDCHPLGREVYILCRQSFGNSKFSNNFLEKKLGVAATTRNWQTMNKLVEMGKSLQA